MRKRKTEKERSRRVYAFCSFLCLFLFSILFFVCLFLFFGGRGGGLEEKESRETNGGKMDRQTERDRQS